MMKTTIATAISVTLLLNLVPAPAVAEHLLDGEVVVVESPLDDTVEGETINGAIVRWDAELLEFVIVIRGARCSSCSANCLLGTCTTCCNIHEGRPDCSCELTGQPRCRCTAAGGAVIIEGVVT